MRPAGPARGNAAAPRATAAPACPESYPSPAAAGPRQRVPVSSAGGLGRRTTRLTTLDSAQVPVAAPSTRPARSRSPASPATRGRRRRSAERTELNGHLLTRSPLSSLEELELLRLGVEGKAAGWRTLRELAQSGPRLDRARLDGPISRARQAQSARTHVPRSGWRAGRSTVRGGRMRMCEEAAVGQLKVTDTACRLTHRLGSILEV